VRRGVDNPLDKEAMSEIKRGVAIIHYNRIYQIAELVERVKKTVPEGTKIIVCDDGSNIGYQEGGTMSHVHNIADDVPNDVMLIRGPNKGVGYNKNRALWALQDCHYICMIEDDLFPKERGWFEIYEEVAKLTNNHHFCRVEDKQVEDHTVGFTEYLQTRGYTPILGSSPRGDFTFITASIIASVGGFNPRFRGIGYSHGNWQNRIAKAGLLCHPLKWLDIKEARDKFEQKGDTEGGRWKLEKSELKKQLTRNKKVTRELEQTGEIYHPLVFE
jgi:glycosyltransferase involved in cell wall biosynthesis